MPIQLYRVDERLIHGQVVVGWGRRLEPRRYLVVDDALAASEWEQELYLLALDGDVEAEFSTVEEAQAHLSEWKADPRATVLLTRDVASMARLGSAGGLAGEPVNLGGLHPAEGRRMVRPWLHLSPPETAAVRELVDQGADVGARDLPDAPRVGLDELLPE